MAALLTKTPAQLSKGELSSRMAGPEMAVCVALKELTRMDSKAFRRLVKFSGETCSAGSSQELAEVVSVWPYKRVWDKFNESLCIIGRTGI